MAQGELQQLQSRRGRLHFLADVPSLDWGLGYGSGRADGRVQQALGAGLFGRRKARDGDRLAAAFGVPVYGSRTLVHDRFSQQALGAGTAKGGEGVPVLDKQSPQLAVAGGAGYALKGEGPHVVAAAGVEEDAHADILQALAETGYFLRKRWFQRWPPR